MHAIKRVLGFCGLTCLLGALALALPAPAPAEASGVSSACVIAGDLKTVPPIPFFGSSGTFTLNSLAIVCVGVEKGTPALSVQNVRATGTYVNIVCGTGKAIGTITGFTGKYAAYFNKKFAVEFVATVGVFYWHQSALPLPNLKPLPGDNGLKRWKPAGYVNLLPPVLISIKGLFLPVPPVCTKAFDFVGTVLVTDPKVP